MHTWKTALLTLLIFGLGAVAGGLVTSKLAHARIEKGRSQTTTRTVPLPPYEAEWNEAQLDVMQRQVGFSPDQRRQVADIFSKAQRELQSAREDWKNRMRELLQRSDRALLGLLTPEQRPRFEEFRQKRRQYLQQRRQNNSAPPPSGPLRERMEQFRENNPAAPRGPRPESPAEP
jgi:Spy/CpxP family protein refolding chaperone